MPKYRNLSLIQVKKLASKLAREVSKKPTTIGLIGNLGSGKTTFAKAFANALGINSLKSPTFIVSQRYEWGDKHLYHLDFYRLEKQSQLLPIGLPEIINSDSIAIIEWADKFPNILRKCGILIYFQVKPKDKRDVEIKYKK